MVLNRWFLFLLSQLLQEVNGTVVKLNKGGFEDVIVAINPGLPEDPKIVDNIKDMIKEASMYLFNATQLRFYFKTIKIIIPLTWTKKLEYKKITTESYEKADVIVADPFLKYGDDPYTLQYGGCGERGRYIHFTSNFLTNDKLVDIYGPRGRVFVHEWAHFRWGVFDEYNYDAPFYVFGPKKTEATRCPVDITGKYVFRTSNGSIRTCKVEQQTGLYEDGCQFVPENQQRTSASIMYMQGLFSVTQFCNQSNHNIQATNMQNKKCDYRSTWEVIMDSADFISSTPISTPPPIPIISLLQAQDRVVCLVLDVSGSMRWYNRLNRLRQATELFLLQIIEMGSWVGIVTFENNAKIVTGLQRIINDGVRESLTNYLPTTADGGTKICSGIHAGFQVFLQKFTSSEGCEIVLVTDGEDSTLGNCIGEVTGRGVVVHTIALGPRAAKGLEMLSDITGGLKFLATNSLNSNGLIDAFSRITSGNGNISQLSIQLESKSQSIGAGEWLDGVISIDKTVGNDTFFVITWSNNASAPGICLKDPKGQIYLNRDFVIWNGNVRTARLKITGIAEVGDWTYKIQNMYTKAQALSMTATTRAASLSESPVIVKSYVNKGTNNYPNPMVIYAEVSQGFLPVINANVTATVEPDSGTAVELELLDNGAGADIFKHDGIYSRYFTSYKENGRYSVKVYVQGKEKSVRRVRRQSQAIHAPGYVENGIINLNPPRSEATDVQANLGNFSRVASGGSFVVASIPCEGPRDVFPPSKITDLEVEPAEDDKFLLSWTAPGNDFDSGKANRYEIKMSKNLLELRNATFQSAISVNTLDMTPAMAGTKESFLFKPENVTEENDITIYLAIRAIDDNNNVGEASNIARTVLRKPLPTTLPLNTTVISTRHSNVETTFTTVSHNENSSTISTDAISSLPTTLPLNTTATSTSHSNVATIFTTASHKETSLTHRSSTHSNLKTTFTTSSHYETSLSSRSSTHFNLKTTFTTASHNETNLTPRPSTHSNLKTMFTNASHYETSLTPCSSTHSNLKTTFTTATNYKTTLTPRPTAQSNLKTTFTTPHYETTLTPRSRTHSNLKTTFTTPHYETSFTPRSSTHSNLKTTFTTVSHNDNYSTISPGAMSSLPTTLPLNTTATSTRHSIVGPTFTTTSNYETTLTPRSSTHSNLKTTFTTASHYETSLTPRPSIHSNLKTTFTTVSPKENNSTISTGAISSLPTTLLLNTTATSTRHSIVGTTFTTASHYETSLSSRPSTHFNLKTTFTTASHNKTSLTPRSSTHSNLKTTFITPSHYETSLTPRSSTHSNLKTTFTTVSHNANNSTISIGAISSLPTTLPFNTTATSTRHSNVGTTFTTVSHYATSLTPPPTTHSNLKTTFTTVSHSENHSGRSTGAKSQLPTTLLPGTDDTARATTYSNLETTLNTVPHIKNDTTIVIVIAACTCAAVVIVVMLIIAVCVARKRQTGIYILERGM